MTMESADVNGERLKALQALCLADEIRLEDLAGLGLGEEDLFVCRDVALDDEAAANLTLQCRLKTI